MTPKQRSRHLRTCGYKETADCMDKMIAVLEWYANIGSMQGDKAKEALK